MSREAIARDRGLDATIDRIVLDRGLKRTVVRLPRFGVASLVLLVVGLVGWSALSAGYIFFHDTVVSELRRNAKARASGYEVQITTLRDELERVRTRRLVEQAGLDERLAELGARQAAIETRQSRLASLAASGGAAVAEARDPAFTYSVKPVPLDQPSHALEPLEPVGKPSLRRESAVQALDRIETALDSSEADQARALEGIATATANRRRTLERVYDAAGVKKPAAETGGRGGPFEPLPETALTFDARADQISVERSTVKAFERGLDRVPLRTPSPGSAVTSSFGARVDPFLGRPAFHAGLDFESDLGEPVRATATGLVVSAGWSGGYGNMVEIDHGGGLSTRIGHLSAILVKEGDEVRIGAAIGKAGSTGRSTGPHVHYETRVNGAAVDPLRFLNAGRILVTAK